MLEMAFFLTIASLRARLQLVSRCSHVKTPASSAEESATNLPPNHEPAWRGSAPKAVKQISKISAELASFKAPPRDAGRKNFQLFHFLSLRPKLATPFSQSGKFSLGHRSRRAELDRLNNRRWTSDG